MKQKMTRYIIDYKKIENLIFNVIPCIWLSLRQIFMRLPYKKTEDY